MVKICWEDNERGRYYMVHLHQDLFGDWLLTRAWGSKDSHRGRVKHDLVNNEHDGKRKIKKIAARRRQHGYLISEGDMECLTSDE